MQVLISILSFLKGLGPLIYKSVLTLFVFNKGVNNETAKGKEKEVKDAKEAGKRKNHISTLSDDDLDDGLRAPKSTTK